MIRSNWKIESTDDIFFVLFPSWVYMVWAVLGAGPVLLIAGGLVGSAADPVSAAWYRAIALVVASTGSFAMLQYEVLHSYHHAALPTVRTASLPRPTAAALPACPHCVRVFRRGPFPLSILNRETFFPSPFLFFFSFFFSSFFFFYFISLQN